ncbi:MAG: hypothetical protein FJW31_26475 [Acidobacteria bacterium]|nr:hypothetical protein [Acidobacteriota bacterium]
MMKAMDVLLAGLLWAAGTAQPIRQVDFRNFTYETCFDDGPGLVKNGERKVKDEIPGVGGDPFFRVREVVFGDLDGDGQEEAVVDTLCSGGGSGRFTEALLFRWQAGKAVLIDKTGHGDRAWGGLHRVPIAAGRLHVARYGGTSGRCCADYIETRRFQLKAGRLVPDGDVWRSDYVSRDSTHSVRQIHFPAGSSSTTVHGATTEQESYRIPLQAGQTIHLYVGGENAALQFRGGVDESKSQPMLNEHWASKVPSTGDHVLSVSAAMRGKPATFSITIEIR